MNAKLSKTEQKRIRGLLLIKSSLSVPDIGKKHNVTRQFVYQIIEGKHSSAKALAIREDIAQTIGLKVNDIWL